MDLIRQLTLTRCRICGQDYRSLPHHVDSHRDRDPSRKWTKADQPRIDAERAELTRRVKGIKLGAQL